MTREQKIVEAKRMRANGTKLREIAERFDVSKTTALRWTDPAQNEKHLVRSRAAKKRRQVATCRDCGAKLAYDCQENERCVICRREYDYGEENREIQRLWAEGYTGEEISAKLETGITPENVRGRVAFQRKSGRVSHPIHRESNRHLWPEIERLWREGRTLGEIGRALGLGSTDVASRVQHMRRVGIDLPRRRETTR